MKEKSEEKCPYCSAPIQENASFCLHCMKELNEKKVIEKKKPENRTVPLVLIITAGVVLLIAACLILIPVISKRINPAVNTSFVTEHTDCTSESTGSSDNESSADSESNVADETEKEKSSDRSADNSDEITDGISDNSVSNNTENISGKENVTAKTESPKDVGGKTAPITPHTHNYNETIVKNAGCSTEGEKKFYCSCGASYTEKIPASGKHTWIETTSKKHHDEEGHYEEKQVGTKSVTKYSCVYCTTGTWFDSLDALKKHFTEDHSDTDNFSWHLDHLETVSNKKSFTEPVLEKTWVVDKKAYDETIITGLVCSECGIKK